MSNFCQILDFKNLINDSTCSKKPENPACIDLMMTYKPICFQNSITIVTRLSDFHKMTTNVLKSNFKKQNPKLIVCQNCKN